ncbi:MAG: hypothetical protein ACYTDT_09240 [Planctomycetota bacterium]
MIEFTRQNYLWLLSLVAVWFVAWLLARRFTQHRVTYGNIWRKVAAKALPPAWKRLLRILLTWTFALTAIASGALYSAGAQKPTADQPTPLCNVIWLDNTYSMRLQHDGKTRLQLAHERAAQILEHLPDGDLAVVGWSSFGQPFAGNFLKHGDAPPPIPATDLHEISSDQLGEFVSGMALPDPRDNPPEWRKVIWWLSDRELKTSHRKPADVAPFATRQLGKHLFVHEPIGELAKDYGILNAALKLTDIDSEYLAELTFEASGETFIEINGQSTPVESPALIPRQPSAQTVRLFTTGSDNLLENDSIEFKLDGQGLHEIVLCYPASDDEPNELLLEILQTLLPGREIRSLPVKDGKADLPANIDLLIADRALPMGATTRFALYFGVAPDSLGKIRAPIVAEPNMQIHPDTDLGWKAPDLRLVSAREARPIDLSIPAGVLVKHRLGGALVATGENFLYSGFAPHQSTLLVTPEGLTLEGNLLLLRWFRHIARPATKRLPLFAVGGEVLKLKLATEVWHLHSQLASYQDATPRRLQPAANGQLDLIAPDAPGRWTLSSGMQQRPVHVFASPDWPVHLTPKDGTAVDLSRLTLEEQTDWRDLLPALLLWIAGCVLILDHLCWLIGLTE